MYEQLQQKIRALHERIETVPDAPSLSLFPLTEKKRVFVVLGIPGCGKSVFLDRISRVVDAPALHMRDFASKSGFNEDELQRASREGRLLEGLDERFLSQVVSSITFLDGFPRARSQAETLVKRSLAEGWELQILFLQLHEGREVAQSFDRQRCRSARVGGDEAVEEARAAAKIERYSENDGEALLFLLDQKVPIHRFNATQGTSKLLRDVRTKFGINLDSLLWDHEILSRAEALEKRYDVPIWLRGEIICRAFWNRLYGKTLKAAEIEFLCSDTEVAKRVSLETGWRLVPWRATNPRAHPPLTHAPFRCLHSASRREEENINVQFGTGAEADLWRGRLQPIEETKRIVPHSSTQLLPFLKRCMEEYPLSLSQTQSVVREPFKLRPKAASGPIWRFRL